MFLSFPIYARFGGGKGAAKLMFSKLFRPAAVSFGTCSSVATIPTNMEVAEETGISKDVTNIVVPMGATMHMDGSAMSAIINVRATASQRDAAVFDIAYCRASSRALYMTVLSGSRPVQSLMLIAA